MSNSSKLRRMACLAIIIVAAANLFVQAVSFYKWVRFGVGDVFLIIFLAAFSVILIYFCLGAFHRSSEYYYSLADKEISRRAKKFFAGKKAVSECKVFSWHTPQLFSQLFMVCSFFDKEIRAGKRLIATVRVLRVGNTLVLAESAGGSWLFEYSCEFFNHRRFAIKSAVSKSDVGFFEYAGFLNGVLQLKSGKRFLWVWGKGIKGNGLFAGISWIDENGRPVMTFNSSLGALLKLRLEGALETSLPQKSMPEFYILSTLGVFLYSRGYVGIIP